MPFGGHQQICHNKIISSLPFIHLLPEKAYRILLKQTGVNQRTIAELMEIKGCRTTIELFKKLVKEIGLTQLNEAYYFINPHYESKFGLKPVKTISIFSAIPILRNFLTTSYFAILKKRWIFISLNSQFICATATSQCSTLPCAVVISSDKNCPTVIVCGRHAWQKRGDKLKDTFL